MKQQQAATSTLPTFGVGDLVLLDTRSYPALRQKKLHAPLPRAAKPAESTRGGTAADHTDALAADRGSAGAQSAVVSRTELEDSHTETISILPVKHETQLQEWEDKLTQPEIKRDKELAGQAGPPSRRWCSRATR